jgi:hypothetical protein
LGTNIAIGKMAAVSVVTSFCLALSGLLYFRSVERTFADVV